MIIVVGVVAFGGRHTAPTSQINATTYNNNRGTTTGNQTNSSKLLFANTQYAPYSYLVYPGPLSQQAQAALAGFNLSSTTLQNSSARITLSLIGSNQQQTIVLKPDYKLYIIETTFGDDSFHFDSSLGDDGFVSVDPNGYVA